MSDNLFAETCYNVGVPTLYHWDYISGSSGPKAFVPFDQSDSAGQNGPVGYLIYTSSSAQYCYKPLNALIGIDIILVMFFLTAGILFYIFQKRRKIK